MNIKRRHAIRERLEEATQLCTKNGAKFTELRRSVLTLILEAGGPLTAYQLLDQLKASRKNAVPPTVYRALDFLIENHLIHKVERLNAFIPCADAGHDHDDHAAQFLICGQCGTVAEIEDQAISKALAKAAEKAGFHPNNAVVELDGTCASCTSARA